MRFKQQKTFKQNLHYTYHHLANLYNRSDEREKAIRVLEDGLTFIPERKQFILIYHLILFYKQIGNEEKSQFLYYRYQGKYEWDFSCLNVKKEKGV